MAMLSDAEIVDRYGPEIGPWLVTAAPQRRALHSAAFPPRAPKWPGAVRLAAIIVPSLTLWAVIAAGLVLLVCGARELAYVAQHPQPAIEAAR